MAYNPTNLSFVGVLDTQYVWAYVDTSATALDMAAQGYYLGTAAEIRPRSNDIVLIEASDGDFVGHVSAFVDNNQVPIRRHVLFGRVYKLAEAPYWGDIY